MPNGSRAHLGSRFPLAFVVYAALALVGLGLAVEGFGKSQTLYQAFAVGVGGALTLPLLLAFWLGERWVRWSKRLGVALLSVACAVACLELWVRSGSDPRFFEARLRDDPVLLNAFEPDVGEVDAWGFRNERLPEQAAIVCLGDSQTWGTNIGPAAAWPSVLASRSGTTTYNMGIGGYGPLQYRALAERALALDPKVLVIGLFLGNDIADAHRCAALEAWSDYRVPEVRYPNAASFANFQAVKPAPNLVMRAIEFLTEESRVIWGMLQPLKANMRTTKFLAGVYWGEEDAPSYDDGELATRFTPKYRTTGVNLARDNVRDGLRITGRALAEISELARAADVEVALMLLGTKEFYYERFAAERGASLGDAMALLERCETELKAGVLEYANGLELRVIDPLPEILRALSDGRPLWPAGSDGHIDAAGSALVAGVVWREIADWFER